MKTSVKNTCPILGQTTEIPTQWVAVTYLSDVHPPHLTYPCPACQETHMKVVDVDLLDMLRDRGAQSDFSIPTHYDGLALTGTPDPPHQVAQEAPKPPANTQGLLHKLWLRHHRY